MMMQALAVYPAENEALLGGAPYYHAATQQQQQQPHHHQAEEEEPPQWPLSVVWLACVALAVLLSGLCVLEIDPSRIESTCGTGMWPLLLARTVCVLVLTIVQWLERSLLSAPRLWFANYLGIAYHLAFTIALSVTIQASGVAGTLPCCRDALEAAATLTHSYALAAVAWLFLAWDALLTLLLLYYELVPADKHDDSSSSSSPPL